MADFYTKTFGWRTQQMGEDMGNYVLATTTESDENGPKNPGAINGGFFTKTEEMPAQYPSVVIAVDDIEESMKKVTTAGGKVLGEPMEIPGVGQYVSYLRYGRQSREHAAAHRTNGNSTEISPRVNSQ